jgi:hypothetical protein
MKDYTRKDDWRIITLIKVELVKRWIDVGPLKISCTRGVVDIEGPLGFSGQGRNAMDSITTIANTLKKIDTALKSVSMVRDVRWQLAGWERTGRFWQYHPTAYIRKIDEKKNLKAS